MTGHLGRGDGRRGPQSQRASPVNSFATPYEDRPQLILVGEGEDPEGSLAAELRRTRANQQICAERPRLVKFLGHMHACP